MKQFMIVGMGGFLGAGIRYVLGLLPWSDRWIGRGTATFVANMLGCFLFGIIVVYVSRLEDYSELYRNFFLIGFCGGLTTFSSYIFDFLGYLEEGRYGQGSLYLLLSIGLGLLVFFIGYQLGHKLFLD